jgi:YVTN family beta-propeller protein
MPYFSNLKRTLTLASGLAALTIAGPVSAASRVNTVIDTIDTHGSAAIVVDQYRGKVYAGGGPGLVVINANNDEVVGSVTLANGPFSGLAIDPRHGKVFSVNYVGAVLSVVDEATDTVTATVPLPGSDNSLDNSLGVAVDPTLGKVYVAIEATQPYVAVIDEKTNQIIDKIEVDQYPEQVAVDPFRHTVYVAAAPAGPYEVYVIDGLTDKVIDTVPTPEAVEVGLAIDPYRGLVYMSGTGCDNLSNCDAPGAVYVLDERTNKITHTIIAAPPAGPDNENVLTEMIAVDPFNYAAYAADFHYGTISVINTINNKLVATITIPGGKNFGVAVDSWRGKVYVSDVIHNDVNVIDAGGYHPIQNSIY